MNLATKVARQALTTSGGSGVRLVYSSSPIWPYGSSSSNASSLDTNLDIAVLDSSFNPPSRAHLALLLSSPILAPTKRAYDGHLLLFSTQNADKGAGKPGDASLSQRVQMMTLMAKDVERAQLAEGRAANVAVALVDKPLIFAKSTLTWDLLKEQQSRAGKAQEAEPKHTTSANQAEARLHWVVGFDTLYRVFQLKYYPSLDDFQQQCKQFFDKERTTFVCARRDPSSYPQLISQTGDKSSKEDAQKKARSEEDKLLESEYVAPWVRHGSVGMLDIDPNQAKLSSTKIRQLLKDKSVTSADKKGQLNELVPPSLVEYLVESRIYQDEV